MNVIKFCKDQHISSTPPPPNSETDLSRLCHPFRSLRPVLRAVLHRRWYSHFKPVRRSRAIHLTHRVSSSPPTSLDDLTLYSCMNASKLGTLSPTSFMIVLNWARSLAQAGPYLGSHWGKLDEENADGSYALRLGDRVAHVGSLEVVEGNDYTVQSCELVVAFSVGVA